MIGRKSPRISEDEDDVVKPKGFDDFELRLGDTMRGERATMGKSLLDVQRELRIKASYIAAIENSDPSAFDTPGFIAGYVRSYARYLGMDPDDSFATFCQESGFSVAHGMSAEASVVKKQLAGEGAMPAGIRDPFETPNTLFVPGGDGLFSQIEPRAIGSTLVLLALIGGIGYGAWSVLKEVQQVRIAPVEQAPVVLSDLDPLNGPLNGPQSGPQSGPLSGAGGAAALANPTVEALDRLYRPQALDVPVLVARDAPISSLDPREVGTFATPAPPQLRFAERELAPPGSDSTDFARLASAPVVQAENVPQVVEPPKPALQIVAVRPSWVRIKSADGTVIFEKVMEPGETWEPPQTEEAPVLRTGESGAIYFALNGTFYGPVGPAGAVTSNLALSVPDIQDTFAVADMTRDEGLIRYAEARGLPVIEGAE